MDYFIKQIMGKFMNFFYKIYILIAIIFIAGFVTYKSISIKQVSDPLLENVEALASGESSSMYCPYSGYMCILKYTNGTYETIPDHWP